MLAKVLSKGPQVIRQWTMNLYITPKKKNIHTIDW